MALILASAAVLIESDPAENVRAICCALRQAKAAGADMVHFPEGAASGYAKSEVATWEDYPWAALRTSLEAVAEEAKRLQLWAILGAAHRLTPPNPPHNALYVIAPDGSSQGRYDKRFCSNSELAGRLRSAAC